MEEFTPFEQAMLKGQNKQMHILKVVASTLHRGVELLSTQAHTGLTEVAPLLQQAVATVRLKIVACSALAQLSTYQAPQTGATCGGVCMSKAAACGLCLDISAGARLSVAACMVVSWLLLLCLDILGCAWTSQREQGCL